MCFASFKSTVHLEVKVQCKTNYWVSKMISNNPRGIRGNRDESVADYCDTANTVLHDLDTGT